MRQLLKARIRADVASDGAEGLAKIGAAVRAGTPYAAILLDIEMRASLRFCLGALSFLPPDPTLTPASAASTRHGQP